MAVLFIAGLLAGAVLLVMPGPDRSQREAARQMAARIAAAGDESIMINRRIALVVTPEGYGFERLESNGWVRIGDRNSLAFRAWPRGVSPAPPPVGSPSAGRIATFDPVGGASPVRIVLGGEGSGWAVEVDSAGAIHVDRAS